MLYFKHLNIAQLALLIGALVTGFANKAIGEISCLPLVGIETKGAKGEGKLQSRQISGKAYIFFDASSDMEGFVGSTQADGHDEHFKYERLVRAVPHILRSTNSKVVFQKWSGVRVRPLRTEQAVLPAQRRFYQCDAIPQKECVKLRPQLQRVLPVAARGSIDDLFVFLTDLSLSDTDLLNERLTKAFSDVIKSDRAIGLLAVKAGYSGTVYNLPGGNRFADAKARPVFALMIGSAAKILRLKTELFTDTLRDVPLANKHFVLFTRKLIKSSVSGADLPENYIKTTENIKRVHRLIEKQSGVHQFTLRSRDDAELRVQIPLNQIQIDGTLPFDEFSVQPKLWMMRDSDTCQKRWLSRSKLPPDLINVEREKSNLVITLFGGTGKRIALPKRRTFLTTMAIEVSGSVSQRVVDRERNEWFDKWGYDESTNVSAISTEFFPARNLTGFVGLLQQQVKNYMKSQTLFEFSLAFHLE